MPEQINSSTSLRAMRRPGQRLSSKERKAVQEKFLKAFSSTANVRAACVAAGIDRSMVYYWQDHDEPFAARLQVANEEANDLIRAAMWRRGVEGVEVHVVSMGKMVYGEDDRPLKQREYSDSLLMLLAKARMPEFRDKQHIDITAQVTALAETAKQELLADLAQAVADENQEPSHQS